MPRPLPVIVGVGQVCDRGDDLATKREPLGLIEAASRLAFDDASCLGLAEQVDSVRVVNMLSGGVRGSRWCTGRPLGLGER
jgi:hypothetical protein